MRFWERLVTVLACMVLGFMLFAGPARCEIIDRTVATVNGEIILYSEVLQQIKAMEKIYPELKNLDAEKRKDIERDALTQLVRQKLTEQEVKRLKVTVSNAEIDAAVDNIRKENNLTPAQFESAMKQSGQTSEKFRQDIKKELERNRLLERVLKGKTVITDAQVDAYLKEGPRETATATGPQATGSQRRIDLGIIFLPVDEKQANAKEVEKTGRDILEQIKSGADFKKMAIQYSKGPAAQDGGDIGLISPEDLAPYIADAVRNLQKNQVSNLVRGQGGYYLFKIFDVETPKQSGKPVSNLREKARKELFQQEVNRKFEEWVRNLESKAFIQITL